jgi:hypothetical protein
LEERRSTQFRAQVNTALVRQKDREIVVKPHTGEG